MTGEAPRSRPNDDAYRRPDPSRDVDMAVTRDPSVIEIGGPPRDLRPVRWMPVVIALVAGLVAGYAVGHRGGRAAPTGSPSPTGAMGATGARCWSSIPIPGSPSILTLGIEVENDTTAPVTLNAVDVVLPMGGLEVLRTGRGACGEPDGPVGVATVVIPPGGSIWLTANLLVTVAMCPAPLPVLFGLTYERAGQSITQNLGGFPDLGDVPYPTCT